MNKKKYLLMPGYITSETDGDTHYISPLKLSKLYQIDIHDCIIYDPRFANSNKVLYDNLIQLTPQYNGDYTIPEK
jgi:hypothetical protein